MAKSKNKQMARGKSSGRKSHAKKINPASLLSKFKNKDCIITFHSLADLDACASAIAIAEEIGDGAVIAMQDRINSESLRVLGGEAERFALFSDAIRDKSDAKIILLDCNERQLVPFLKKRKVDLLIDHHALSKNSVRGKAELVEPEAVATCQLVSQMIKNPNQKQAELLVLGILSDSAHLSEADEKTFLALALLLPHCGQEYSALASKLQVEPKVSSRMAVLEGLRNVVFAQEGGLVCATSMAGANEGQVANILLMAGADCAFSGAGGKRNARISARMRSALEQEVDLPKIMKEVGKFIGGDGGGHACAAGATGTKGENIEDGLALAQKLFFERAGTRIRLK